MNKRLIKDLFLYFEQKESPTSEEVNFLKQLTDEKEMFHVCSISKQKMEDMGFDTSQMDDIDMMTLADKFKDALCDNGYNDILSIVAEDCMNIPLKNNTYCPKCMSKHIKNDHETSKYECYSCGQTWKNNLYVLVEYPEATFEFEENEIGYHCFNSQNNGARYVSEFDYINQFKKTPEADKCFRPLCFPDSQSFFDLPQKQQELCEQIIDDKTLSDFGSSAIWIPLSLIKND